MLEIQVLAWDRHTIVVGLYLENWISNGNTCTFVSTNVKISAQNVRLLDTILKMLD
jgi:hypothetical protein